jgi:hypothetical protein
MKRLLLFLAIFLVAATSAFASDICSDAMDQLTITEGATIPDFIPYKNDVMNVYTGENETVGYVAIEDGKLAAFACNESSPDYTYRVYIESAQTIEDIVIADAPADALDDKMSEGEIRIEGRTFGKKVKSFFTRIGIKIASWFT